jgi:hypothetical protein
MARSLLIQWRHAVFALLALENEVAPKAPLVILAFLTFANTL